MRVQTSRQFLLAGTILAGVVAAAPAFAQDAPAGDQEAVAIDEVVVTGSRIRRQDYVANSPIVTVGVEDFQDTGSVTIDTLLNDMPQFVPSVNMTSNNPSNGGQANIDLRGLGTQRNLILLDGRRVVPSNPDGTVDVNLIPTALVQSVEVITGGASATYGSDALGGVTNFILKPNFSGVQFDAQYGVTDRSDGETDSFSLTLGGDLDGGRGNAVVSLGYSSRSPIFNAARDFSSISGGSAASPLGNTVFDANNLPTQAAVTAVLPGGQPSDTFGFNPNGTVFAYRGRLGFESPGGIDYDGFGMPGPRFNPDFAYNTGPLNFLTIPLERYTAFGRATYELNAAAEIYGQALFTQYESTQILAPTPAAGTATGFRVPSTNPFITPELRTLLNSRPNPAGTFRLDKRFNAVGPREAISDYNVYQLTTGVRGDVPGSRDWTYDAYAQFGRVSLVTTQNGNISRSAVQRLLDAADGGTSLCAGGFNFVGDNPLSAACSAFVGRTSKNTTVSDQRIVEATLQGGLFDLPAGELSFAAGVGYREETFTFRPDALLSTGDVAGFNAQQALQGSTNVREIFAEFLVPVFKDIPFVKELELSLAYRLSDYSTVGQVSAYKADGNWTVVDGLQLRGGYQRAVRAPSIGELFQPQNLNFPNIGTPRNSQNQPQFSGDPCDIRGAYRSGANATAVRGLCLAQGLPGQVIDTFTYTNSQVPGLIGGNPDLSEETADTFSIGAVWQPRFASPWLDRFSTSIDYYDIAIEDVIDVIPSSELLKQCYNANGTSNPTYDPNNLFCTLFRRDPASGQIDRSLETVRNNGGLNTSGVDFQLDWGFDLDGVGLSLPGALDLNLIVGWLNIFEEQPLPGGAFTDRTGTIANQIGNTFPEWKVLTSVSYSNGPFRVAARWRRVGEVENFNNRAEVIDAHDYFDLTGSWMLTERISVRAGVNNLGDEQPPTYTPSIQANTDPSTYDILGRRYFIGLTAKF